MYQYVWDENTGGLLLTPEQSKFSKEPRPVYYKELDILGFDQYWNYLKDDHAPLLWAEANKYIYKGRTVAKTKGGSLYTPPELILLDTPEPNGGLLQFVDVDAMVENNRDLLETLVQETIQKIYNTYMDYKEKVDVFYVAFSGGKDSVVALNLVQQALPHNEFMVLFGDTQMEFPDTYVAIKKVKNECEKEGIAFHVAKYEQSPLETWKIFGPPSTVTRWCCSVHKTSPQILLLRELLDKPDFIGMAFVGVRADESVARSKYEYVTLGGKHKGQYSCNAIIDWNSAEVFLHIYMEKLIINDTYKKGNRRAGCLICPRAAERNDFMNHNCYRVEAEPFVNIIRECYKKSFTSSSALEQFIRVGGWKARKNGRDISIPVNYSEVSTIEDTLLSVTSPHTDWKVWIGTIGILLNNTSPYRINFRRKTLEFVLIDRDNGYDIAISKKTIKEDPEFLKLLKNVFRKAACCVGCKECQADCPYGCISFKEGNVEISERCIHCAQCHKVEKGCLVYKSLEQPKGGIVMAGKSMSLNSYSHHAPKIDWMRQYFKFKTTFNENHNLGSQMYSFFKRFLRDANLLDKTGFSKTSEIIESMGMESEQAWGIIFVNLCYAAQVGWFVSHIDFNEEYTKAYLANMMIEDGAKESWTNDIFSSLSRLSELPMGNLGFGTAIRKNNKIVSICRLEWDKPIAEVILYSLYKFAEACGDYYQFSLDTLMDNTIDREGVSPSRIFGLDQDSMVRILNGLSINYPEFIAVSFTLDLDSITLRANMTSANVLQLF
jgi:phosphoadenosine phosphosulfate reductase